MRCVSFLPPEHVDVNNGNIAKTYQKDAVKLSLLLFLKKKKLKIAITYELQNYAQYYDVKIYLT